MPALCAATGSFHVKSATTCFVMVLIMVRVLPFFLTVSLICSVTLFVSILGVRSYSDQRYSSMQISTTRHSSGVSTGRTVGLGCSSTGSDVDTDASCARVSGGVERGSGKGASKAGASAAEGPAISGGSGSAVGALLTDTGADATAGSGSLTWDPATAATEAIALAGGALTGSPASALKGAVPRIAPRFPLGVAVLPMPNEPRTPSLAAPQSTRATVPHNITNAIKCRGLNTQSPPRARP